MPPEVMTLHAVSREIRPTSIAPGLKLFLKDTPTLHSPDRALHSPDRARPARSAPSPQGTTPPCPGRYREHTPSPQKHTSYLQCQLGSATDGLSLITPLSVL